jgi:hypothetical protein
MSKTMRFVIPTALALAAALSAGAAQARDADVRWSVTIGSPVYSVPAPVYSVPAPVYVRPQPVYYVAPPPVYYAPLPAYGYAVPAAPVARYRIATYWDRDGDGIPNRHDRVYNPAWDRDGDGIPNRHDRVYNQAWDRDGDGIPNRYDRHPRDGGRR